MEDYQDIKKLSYNEEKYYTKEYLSIKSKSEEFEKLERSLLDSSLISTTIPKIEYDIKVITCGKYRQYFKKNIKITRSVNGYEKDKKEENILKLRKILNDIDEDNIFNLDTSINKEPTLKQIEEKNIIRSKNNMCRLILANEDKFTTFITLTFADNITDITYANREFNKFISKIKRVFPELLYVAVPEFQKNERIHYHLLTNITYSNDFLINENISMKKLYHKFGANVNLEQFYEENIILKEDENLNDREIVLRLQDGIYENTKQTYNWKTKQLKTFKTIKYWNNGFSNVMKIDLLCGDKCNIARYMSKYMMKDLDNRLFGKKRYFYSQNLEKPVISYLDSSNSLHKWLFESDINNSNIKYQKTYKDTFDNDIEFYEIQSDKEFVKF